VKGWVRTRSLRASPWRACSRRSRSDHWDGDVPVGRDEPNAWIQLVAVSLQQTQNTMKLFPALIGPEARKHYGIQVGEAERLGFG